MASAMSCTPLSTPLPSYSSHSANILLTETWRGRLGDFGVVRFLPSPLTTHTTTVVGTLVYMAPEYSKGGLISPAADVFSFGVVRGEGVRREEGGMKAYYAFCRYCTSF